jgi:hypothetical protein
MALYLFGLFLQCAAFVGGLCALVCSLILTGFGGCHGQGGFCSGGVEIQYYVYAVLAAFAAGGLLALPFTRKLAKLLTSGAILVGITLIWIALIETHI